MQLTYEELVNYIKENGITLVTIQPELMNEKIIEYCKRKGENTIYFGLHSDGELSTYDSDTELKNNIEGFYGDYSYIGGWINTYTGVFTIGGVQKNKSFTYEIIRKRSDGVIFKEDSIDGRSIEDVMKEISDHRRRASRLQGRVNAHKKMTR